jgi:hypothetical protein
VVTVDGSRSSDRGHASRHELQNGHLSGGILASDTVGAELQVGLATLNLLSVRVVKVRVQNLLGVCERTLQATTDNVQVLRHLLVVDVVTLLSVGHLDLLVERGVTDGSEGPGPEELHKRSVSTSALSAK